MGMENFGKITIMNMGWLIIFTSFMTCQNFSSKVLMDCGFESTGYKVVAAMFVTQSISGFFANPIVSKYDKSYVFFIASLFWVFWIMSFILPAKYSEYIIDNDG